MAKRLEHYVVIAERETGFWLTLPAPTGKTVARDDWLKLNDEDPEHFQLISLSLDAHLPPQLMPNEAITQVVIEQAVFVMWSDEVLQ
ncbi:hypothetical protein LK540_21800 [Massilia sp. IC2-278]|uniref:hypothetical protein n=1 Tax=Massilia sp. IC2-278 TaxID=2887200 RepID=UPI001E2CF48B|nr:hypothetical protein [Massilia sp. IC2-278]MCC2963072.1 hypothetical protein [Massilia sp. IC2-278]